jgi:hypothetical protein
MAWLARHGVASPFATEPVEIEEVERIDMGTDVARGVWRGLFQYELRRTADEDITCDRARALPAPIYSLPGRSERRPSKLP